MKKDNGPFPQQGKARAAFAQEALSKIPPSQNTAVVLAAAKYLEYGPTNVHHYRSLCAWHIAVYEGSSHRAGHRLTCSPVRPTYAREHKRFPRSMQASECIVMRTSAGEALFVRVVAPQTRMSLVLLV